MPLLLPAWQHRHGVTRATCCQADSPCGKQADRDMAARSSPTLRGYTHIYISHVCAWQEGWAQRL